MIDTRNVNSINPLDIETISFEVDVNDHDVYYVAINNSNDEYLSNDYDFTIIRFTSDEDAVTNMELVFEEEEYSVSVGSSCQINAIYMPDGVKADNLEWHSSDESIAIIDNNGLATGLSVGIVTITASSGGKSISCILHVTSDGELELKFENDEYSVLVGSTCQINAVYMPDGIKATNLKWHSSDESVATIDNDGVATGLSVGTITITASLESITISCFLNVTDREEVLPDDIPEDGKIPNGLWIAGISDTIYTGKAIKPSVRVYDHETRLVEKKDYIISYKNNINANEALNESKAPSVIVKAKGNYTGREVANFKILQKDINSTGFDVIDIAVAPKGKVQKPVPVLMFNGKKLSSKKDYTVTYPDISAGAYKEKGTYVIKITGKGNYTGERKVNFIITDSNLMSKATISKISSQQYTGEKLTPIIKVKYGKTILREGTDYELEYRNNTEIGTASVVVKGKGNYCGQKSISFKITGIAINKAKVIGLSTQDVYSGSEITKECSLVVSVNGSQKNLKEGQDYTIAFQNNKNAGKATVVFTGINGYTGTLKKTFRIAAYDIQENAGRRIRYDQNLNVPYAKNGSCPNPVIYFGETRLIKNKDYSLSYKNNKTVSNGSNSGKMPTIIVKGKGNFKGTVSITFSITVQDFENIKLTANDKVYKKRSNMFSTNIKLIDVNGKALSAGKDYEKDSITYTYVNTVVLENGIIKEAGSKVEKTDIIPANTTIQVTVKAKSGGCYTGITKGMYRIIESDIKNAKVTIPTQIYSGYAIKPDKSDITVYVGKYKLKETEFEIVSCKNNIKKGKASITIKGIGNFSGTKTAKFSINSKGFSWWWRK